MVQAMSVSWLWPGKNYFFSSSWEETQWLFLSTSSNFWKRKGTLFVVKGFLLSEQVWWREWWDNADAEPEGARWVVCLLCTLSIFFLYISIYFCYLYCCYYCSCSYLILFPVNCSDLSPWSFPFVPPVLLSILNTLNWGVPPFVLIKQILQYGLKTCVWDQTYQHIPTLCQVVTIWMCTLCTLWLQDNVPCSNVSVTGLKWFPPQYHIQASVWRHWAADSCCANLTVLHGSAVNTQMWEPGGRGAVQPMCASR